MSADSVKASGSERPSGTEDTVLYRSLYSIFSEVASSNRSNTAVIFWKRRFTYDAILRMTDSVAESLRNEYLLPRGARVGILLPNSPQYVVSMLAASKTGAISVPMNPRASVREIENVASHSGMRCLFTTEKLLGKVKHLAGENLLIVVTRMQDFVSLGTSMRKIMRRGFNYIDPGELKPSIVKFSDLAYSSGNGPEEDYSPDDVCMLAYSGSTSSSPRAAALTIKNIHSNIMNVGSWFPRITRKTVTIASVPFYHMYSLVLALLVPLSLGSSAVMVEDDKDMGNILDSITEYVCDYFVGNPSIFREMLKRKDLLKYRIRTVKVFISGGDMVSEELAREFEESTKSGIVTTYGTRELSGVSHINTLDRKRRKYSSIGVLIGGTEARIIDEDTGNDVQPGTIGILVIKGNQVMREYWDNQMATAEVLRDGWFVTGDRARVDEDGFFYIYERRKESIVSDSSMVSATEIEEVIRQNSKVGEVAVIGLPDEKRGEIIKAYIIPREGEKLTQKELEELCRKQLSEYKLPSVYEFRQDLPRNMEGQVIKRILKEEALREAGNAA